MALPAVMARLGIFMIHVLGAAVFLPASPLFAGCDEYRLSIPHVSIENNCFAEFSALFEHKGCEYNCFGEISRFLVKQGETVKADETGIFTTYLSASFHSAACSEEMVTLELYDQSGERLCQKTFNLNAVHQELVAQEHAEQETNSKQAAATPAPVTPPVAPQHDPVPAVHASQPVRNNQPQEIMQVERKGSPTSRMLPVDKNGQVPARDTMIEK